ncbi:MAG: 1,4-alpha-glucan branching protein GlgB [Myxococcota bacterium]
MTSRITGDDLHLFNEGNHFALYDKLGAHLGEHEGQPGAQMAVWAPDAKAVHVIGNFNGWKRGECVLVPRDSSGIWEGWVPRAHRGDHYKFVIETTAGELVEKADPYGFFHETPPRTASILWDLEFPWSDHEWMKSRATLQDRNRPISIYEVHLGSWKTVVEDGNRPLSYRELAETLPDYVADLGFTHVELMPVMEHPFGGSWGYQLTGYFAPTSRLGNPQDLMGLIDAFHRRGIGVIVDWVPAHFATDAHGLGLFDGTHLYEHADRRKGFHPDWTTYIFNYGRHEVRSFLISSAAFWLDRYHVDGLRVDGVASMLYLDYSREEGEWIPNEHGGRENLEAISVLQRMNEHVYGAYPGVQIMAEESTAWPGVSKPVHDGGLGFGFKWDMGWMHDTLGYLAREPIHRKHHHNQLTFRGMYAYSESFVLPLSHDEVVHGKGSLIGKMPGDEWQQRANLRLLYAHMWGTPGKKLLFMGGEFAQRAEWSHERSLDWHLCDAPEHAGIRALVARLNELYVQEEALHARDLDADGFSWIVVDDHEGGVLAYARHAPNASPVVIVCNFTPVVREDYRVGVPAGGSWEELLNSDASEYGGSGVGNLGEVTAEPVESHGHAYSLSLVLPPLAALYFRPR